MANSNGPVIDMTPDGAFIEPPKPTLGTILMRLVAFAVFLCIGAVVFWTALFVIPILIVLGIVGFFLAQMRFRRIL
ncbi:MAG TPA: hypothetical protein VMV54_04775 [Acidocella sp.]|nr:hypothetical protein [Acidocella sp.]